MRRQTQGAGRELRETGGGDSANYDHSLGQMLHKQPEDLSISLWELVNQAVDGLDARLRTVPLCLERVVYKRLQGVPNTLHSKDHILFIKSPTLILF